MERLDIKNTRGFTGLEALLMYMYIIVPPSEYSTPSAIANSVVNYLYTVEECRIKCNRILHRCNTSPAKSNTIITSKSRPYFALVQLSNTFWSFGIFRDQEM